MLTEKPNRDAVGVYLARRIMTVELENPEWVRAGRRPLAIDDWLEVHWRMKMFSDQWTGDSQIFPATHEITRIRGNQNSAIDVYGYLRSDEDKQWLEKATQAPPDGYYAIKHVARVHELGLMAPKTRRELFKIEVLTGPDRDALVNAARRAEWVQFAKEHWWQIGLGLIVLYWWFS